MLFNLLIIENYLVIVCILSGPTDTIDTGTPVSFSIKAT
jgi:hypothetical protein